jgi:hypothetical protein
MDEKVVTALNSQYTVSIHPSTPTLHTQPSTQFGGDKGSFCLPLTYIPKLAEARNHNGELHQVHG